MEGAKQSDEGIEGRAMTGGNSIFKKSGKGKNIRRRTLESGASDGEEEVSRQKSKAPRREGTMSFSTGTNVEKRVMQEDKKRPGFTYESSREVQTHTDSRATAALETETEHDRDARALREKVLKLAEASLRGKADDKVYRGMNAYTDHTAGFRREHTVASEKASGAHGPLRASAHIRTSVRFDYQPDICKDYKETGYCGYGDACKFMHDRGDYKSGWQLEREWDEKEKRRKDLAARGVVEEEEQEAAGSDDDDELPFACFICREPFKDPVVTRCKHYFCEHCALKHNSRDRNCFVCNKPTNGVFNTAHEILKRLKDNGIAGQQDLASNGEDDTKEEEEDD